MGYGKNYLYNLPAIPYIDIFVYSNLKKVLYITVIA